MRCEIGLAGKGRIGPLRTKVSMNASRCPRRFRLFRICFGKTDSIAGRFRGETAGCAVGD